MPTARFYRLPEEKKKAIRDAAIREFIRVPYEKASINKMIQSADISRGSFYTYFEDKADVLSFILQDTKSKGKELAIELLKESQGDIWEMFHGLLQQGLKYCSNHDVFQLFRNVATYPEVEQILRRECETDDGMGAWIRKYVDTSNLCSPDDEGMHDIMTIGCGILGEAIGQFYKNGASLDEVNRVFTRRLEILKRGASKNIQD